MVTIVLPSWLFVVLGLLLIASTLSNLWFNHLLNSNKRTLDRLERKALKTRETGE